MKKLLLILTILLIPSCNIVEGIHQTSPFYKNPVIFSDNWYHKKNYEQSLYYAKKLSSNSAGYNP